MSFENTDFSNKINSFLDNCKKEKTELSAKKIELTKQILNKKDEKINNENEIENFEYNKDRILSLIDNALKLTPKVENRDNNKIHEKLISIKNAFTDNDFEVTDLKK